MTASEIVALASRRIKSIDAATVRQRSIVTKAIDAEMRELEEFLVPALREGLLRGFTVDDILDSSVFQERIDSTLSRVTVKAKQMSEATWDAGQSEGLISGGKEVRASTGIRKNKLGTFRSSDHALEQISDGMDDVAREFRRKLELVIRENAARPALLRGAIRKQVSSLAKRVGNANAYILNRAYNDGKVSAYGDSPVPVKKMWRTHTSERTCPECAALDGHVMDLDEDFDTSASFRSSARGVFLDLPLPPRHPNCRCEIVPWSDDFAATPGTITPAEIRRAAREAFDESA